MRILLTAYACEPKMGSEKGIGWNWVQALSTKNEIYVITRKKNQEIIEQFYENSKTLNKNINWIYFDLPNGLSFWKKGERGLVFYYFLWNVGAFFVAKKHHQKMNFDVIMHVTFGIFWFPIFTSFLKTIFIWGPVGGGEKAPSYLLKQLKYSQHFKEFLRLLNINLSIYNPILRLTASNSNLALSTSEQTENYLKKIGCKVTKILSHVALPQNEIDEIISISKIHYTKSKFIFISIGRLIYWKGLDITVKAYSKLLNENRELFEKTEYWIIGDGIEYENISCLIHAMNLESNVILFGSLERKKVFELLCKSDVLLHPSFHDSGGWVCAEAMASKKPVICFNHGGPSEIVGDSSGIQIKANNYLNAVNEFSKAMHKLIINPEIYCKYSESGRKRILENFTWEKKAEFINNQIISLTR